MHDSTWFAVLCILYELHYLIIIVMILLVASALALVRGWVGSTYTTAHKYVFIFLYTKSVCAAVFRSDFPVAPVSQGN